MCLILAIPALMGWSNPDIDNDKSICPVMRFFGIPCPGCGLTKSVIHAYKGEFGLSLQYNWWGIPLIICCMALIVLQIYDIVTSHQYTERLFSNALVWQILVSLIILTYIIRFFIY